MKLVDALRRLEPVYIISPYTRYMRGHVGAYIDVSKLASRIFLKHKIVVFSPIAHAHGLAAHGVMPAVDPKLWKRFNQPFVDSMRAAIVAKLEGWQDSAGARDEIGDFRAAHKTIAYVDPDTLEISVA